MCYYLHNTWDTSGNKTATWIHENVFVVTLITLQMQYRFVIFFEREQVIKQFRNLSNHCFITYAYTKNKENALLLE